MMAAAVVLAATAGTHYFTITSNKPKVDWLVVDEICLKFFLLRFSSYQHPTPSTLPVRCVCLRICMEQGQCLPVRLYRQNEEINLVKYGFSWY